MNWGAIGAVGEIIGASGVIISVIYLALQIKKQTKESQMAATRDLSFQLQQNVDPILADLKHIAIWGKAVKDYNSLEETERLWATIILSRFFRIAEQQLIHASNSHVNDQYYQSFTRAFFEVLTFPGVQQWWENSGDTYCDHFQEYVENQLPKAQEVGYKSTFKLSSYEESA